MTDNLVAFLDAHIARDERAAATARDWAEAAAKRAIIAEVQSWRHRRNDDPWYSCPATLDEPDRYEGDDREGDYVAPVIFPPPASPDHSCNCGLDQRRAAILRPLAAVYADLDDHLSNAVAGLGPAE